MSNSVGKIGKKQSERVHYFIRHSKYSTYCQKKNTLLQTAFSAILHTGKPGNENDVVNLVS